MKCVRKVTEDIFWVGASDRRLALFENIFPIPRGVSYNAYLLLDEKNVLFDTVDFAVSRQFIENLKGLLGEKTIDYLIVNHMEPDHGATLQEIASIYPDMKIVGNAKTVQMIKQFFDFDIDSRSVVIKEADTLSTGKHTLQFYMAPMVHWPEVMVTYDMESKILFSADAFGTFGALNGNIFNDEILFEQDWMDDARRYYMNIVGKYGAQVQALLKKAANLDIAIICPLHGPVWRSNVEYFINKYDQWSRYEPEENTVMIAYASMYGDTEQAVNILAAELAEEGVKNIRMYDISNTDVSELVSEAFRCSHLVLAAPTYNGGVYPVMETFLLDLKAHNFQNRTVALIENGSWAPAAYKNMKQILEEMKNIEMFEKPLSIKSALKESQMDELVDLKNRILVSLKGNNE
ncbi:FprA family A-type flavoprotein [Anaeromicropila populeti]|uniref:Flavorubredoxin n=1 Tax=Anaeromicropila populeti TaxID=37658 RepID=A0A1I6JYC1_9FIRM|nr:FprA family A-type flavoprotein [Anaeromicropila populeti]SFR83530.1 Flavorubredoxin [Anaeromicropila populeti]